MAEFLSIKQVAEYLGVSIRTIYRLLKKGQLPATRIGWQWRIDKDVLDFYVRSRAYFVADTAISHLFFQPEVLAQYRKDPKYYVQESAYHGRLGLKQEHYDVHTLKSVKWSMKPEMQHKVERSLGIFHELKFWKVKLKDGSLVIVLDPRTYEILPPAEKGKWQSYQIVNPTI